MVSTSILVLSDTHGRKDIPALPRRPFDLVIHCGDLTEEFTLSEFKSTAELLKSVDAPLKLVIAGNHDVTLDEDTFNKHLNGAHLSINDPAVSERYGSLEKALQCLTKDEAVRVLSEGSHKFTLGNGTQINVYASPYTPRREDEGALGSDEAGWAYQYGSSGEQGHDFDIPPDTDIVITHGPPRGVLDRVAGKRCGCPSLFTSVAKVRPLMHCFGHIHAGWGAKNVVWRSGPADQDQELNLFTAIDNEESTLVEDLTRLKANKLDDEEARRRKEARLKELLYEGLCDVSPNSRSGKDSTLFINAAMEGDDKIPFHPPMAVTIDLPTE